ncbi:hypothetical protein ACF0H5_015012 [Mactra antiquata]
MAKGGASSTTDFELVVAIDFGTTGSGYAFQTLADYKADRLKMYENLQWGRETLDYKTPTCLLVSPDRKEILFGDDAEDAYYRLRRKDKPKKWYFFRNFKMQLYHKVEFGYDTLLISENGNELDALFVFSESIKWMKDHVTKFIQQTSCRYLERSTKWVLTVPAIWTEGAKQLMRKSAEMAGINPNRLCIGLEPEAAAIYCTVYQANPQNDPSLDMDRKLETGPGTTNMIVDMGGGTVDITTLNVKRDGTMQQIHMAEGGPAGGQNVDEKFFKLMAEILGEEVWSYFQSNLPYEFYEFRMSFERAKRTIKQPSGRHSRIRDDFLIKLPREIIGECEKASGVDFEDILRRNPRTNRKVEFELGKLAFKCDILREMMIESLHEILNYIINIAGAVKANQYRLDAVIIVGGFASSQFLSEKLREAVKQNLNIPVIRPANCERAVLRGATLFGHNERVLTSRVVRMTYGIGITIPYHKKYPIEKKFTLEGKALVSGVFAAHVTRGQEVKIDEWISASKYYPLEANQQDVDIYVFSSQDKVPTMIDDAGCECIGKFSIRFGDFEGSTTSLSERSTEVSFNFGRTQIMVKATDTQTQHEVSVPLSLKS